MIASACIVFDGFCGMGGAALGMIQAGAMPTGVDNARAFKKGNPRYPGHFRWGNVLTVESWRTLDGKSFTDQFDLLWFSPPCQGYSPMTNIIGSNDNHPRLIPEVRAMADRIGKPYIIENVEGAKAELVDPIMLCGYMFGLRLQHHRCFEIHGFKVVVPEHHCRDEQPEEKRQKYSVVGNPVSCPRKNIDYADVVRERPLAMGITHIPTGSRWFAEAIPPAYSKYIIEQFIRWRVEP